MCLVPTCRCVLLFGENSFGGHPRTPLPSSLLLLLRRHLDADLHRLHHLSQVRLLRVVVVVVEALQTPSTAPAPLAHLVIAAVGQQRHVALLLLVLDEEEDVAQWEGHLTLSAGQQVVVGVQARWKGLGQVGLQQMRR